MALTEEGRIYLEHVVRGLDALEDADRALGPITALPAGTLKVSAPATVTLLRLSRSIPAFLTRHPQLRLDLHLDDRRVDLVADGYDLVVRGSDDLEDSTLIARRLAVMRHVLCAAPSYLGAHGRPARPGDLKEHARVRFSLSGHADLWEFRRGGKVERVPVDARYSVSSSLAVIDAVRSGFGISLIPRPYVADDLASGRLEALLDDWSTVETGLYAVYPSRRHLPLRARVFLDFLREEFARFE